NAEKRRGNSVSGPARQPTILFLSLSDLCSSVFICGPLLLLAGCGRPEVSSVPPPLPEPAQARKAAVAVPPLPFVDITAAAGLRFQHTNGAFGKKLLPETMGAGCAFLD